MAYNTQENPFAQISSLVNGMPDSSGGFANLFANLFGVGQGQAQARPFSLDENTLLELRQNFRSPAMVAQKLGIPVEQIYAAHPEFNPSNRGQQIQKPAAGREELKGFEGLKEALTQPVQSAQ